jgi:hypothetical protein
MLDGDSPRDPLERDGRLVIMEPGTQTLEDAMALMPPRPAVTRLILGSGPYSGREVLV